MELHEAIETVTLWRDMWIDSQSEIPPDEVTDCDLEERDTIVAVGELLSAVATLTAERDRLRELLKECEWVFAEEDLPSSQWYCPICERSQFWKHAKDCELAAALQEPTD